MVNATLRAYQLACKYLACSDLLWNGLPSDSECSMVELKDRKNRRALNHNKAESEFGTYYKLLTIAEREQVETKLGDKSWILDGF